MWGYVFSLYNLLMWLHFPEMRSLKMRLSWEVCNSNPGLPLSIDPSCLQEYSKGTCQKNVFQKKISQNVIL